MHLLIIGEILMNTNLIKSPLFEKIRNYLLNAEKEKTIFLYVPFIKSKIFEKLIDGISNKIIVITDWSPKNLIDASSELELYPICKEKRITLYHNERIHLKVFSIGLESMILSTGNISNRGLMPNGSIELANQIESINVDDRLYLEIIRKESRIIDDSVYQTLLDWQKNNPPKFHIEKQFPIFEKPLTEDDFLIAALPMTRNINTLQSSYEKLSSNLSPNDDDEITNCVYHDLANYEIPLGLSNDEFLNLLKKQFFAHPFIKKIDQFLEPDAHFGRIKEWIQKNCHDVPIPSRRELTGNVQVLFEWFVVLGDGKYVKDVPGTHSERLTKC
tara:strand:+ start:4552 stop:5541 length:990 start_codon:yes stop_codon:yes gene_type:complete